MIKSSVTLNAVSKRDLLAHTAVKLGLKLLDYLLETLTDKKICTFILARNPKSVKIVSSESDPALRVALMMPTKLTFSQIMPKIHHLALRVYVWSTIPKREL